MASSTRHRTKTNPFADDDDDDYSHHDSTITNNKKAPHDPRLTHYETLLSTTIDPDFFTPPSQFHALNRVIDILGVSLQSTTTSSNSSNTNSFNHPNNTHHTFEDYSNNHAYQSLQSQQSLVEEAIEHVAVRHCADLNLSVSAVGRMSRRLEDARGRVGNLRIQVGSVGDSLRLGEVGGLVSCCFCVWRNYYYFLLEHMMMLFCIDVHDARNRICSLSIK